MMPNDTNIIQKLKGIKYKISKKKNNWKTLDSNELLDIDDSNFLMANTTFDMATQNEYKKTNINDYLNYPSNDFSNALKHNKTYSGPSRYTNAITTESESLEKKKTFNSSSATSTPTANLSPNMEYCGLNYSSSYNDNNKFSTSLSSSYQYNSTHQPHNSYSNTYTNTLFNTMTTTTTNTTATATATATATTKGIPSSPYSFGSSDTYINSPVGNSNSVLSSSPPPFFSLNNDDSMLSTMDLKYSNPEGKINTYPDYSSTDPTVVVNENNNLFSPLFSIYDDSPAITTVTITTSSNNTKYNNKNNNNSNHNNNHNHNNNNTNNTNTNMASVFPKREKSMKKVKPLITFDKPPMVTNKTTTEIKDKDLRIKKNKTNKNDYHQEKNQQHPPHQHIKSSYNSGNEDEDDDVPLGIIQYKFLSSILQESTPCTISSLQQTKSNKMSHFHSTPSRNNNLCYKNNNNYDNDKVITTSNLLFI